MRFDSSLNSICEIAGLFYRRFFRQKGPVAFPAHVLIGIINPDDRDCDRVSVVRPENVRLIRQIINHTIDLGNELRGANLYLSTYLEMSN